MEYRQERHRLPGIGSFTEIASNHHIIRPRNLRLRFQTQKHFFWIHVFIRATDSRENLPMTCEHISNRQNRSSTQNSPPVTLRASGKVALTRFSSQLISEVNFYLSRLNSPKLALTRTISRRDKVPE